MNPNAASIDLGATVHYVAVPADRDPQPVRHFGPLTEDLQALADWLAAFDITTVAMEATGVYWIPLFQIRTEPERPAPLMEPRRGRRQAADHHARHPCHVPRARQR